MAVKNYLHFSKAQKRQLCPAAPPPSDLAYLYAGTKIALICFNFSRELIALNLTCNQCPEIHVKLNCSDGLDFDDFSGSTRCRSRNNVLNEPTLL